MPRARNGVPTSAAAACVVSAVNSAGWLDRNMDSFLRAIPGRHQEGVVKVEEPTGSAKPAPDLTGLHVLVLEDRLVNQTVIRRQLDRLNVNVTLLWPPTVSLD